MLAGFGGATGLRVKPGPEYAEGVGHTVGQTGTDEPGWNTQTGGGLLYEVEELTRVDCADLRDVRETLALARARRDGKNGLKRSAGPSETAAATVSELWITTTETRVLNRGHGLNRDGGFGDETRRTVHRRCARVVDVGGGDGVTSSTPLFNLGQLVRGVTGVTGVTGLAGAPSHGNAPDWRRSALTKIMKGPLTGTGTLSVLVATAASEAHAADALGALRLAAAAKRLPGRGPGVTGVTGPAGGMAVRKVVERPALSRRERLERTLELARSTARATVLSEGLGEMTTPPGRRSAAERRAREMSMDVQLTPEHVRFGLSPTQGDARTPGRSFRPGPRSASKR